MNITKWIHHLLNPHCEHCKEEAEDNKVCKSCEVLRSQLDIANFEKRQLLQAVLDSTKPKDNTEQAPQINYEAIKPSSTHWAVRKQMLEAEDRQKAAVLKKYSETPSKKDLELEELEKSLGIVEGD